MILQPLDIMRTYGARHLYKFNKDDQEKKLFDSFTLFPWLCVPILFKSLLEIKIEIESRLHCIDI